MNQETPYFVGIKNPSDLRRHLLNGAKDGLHVLQLSEEIKTVREKQKQLLLDFQKNIFSMNKNLLLLQKYLPEHNKHSVRKHLSKYMTSSHKQQVADVPKTAVKQFDLSAYPGLGPARIKKLHEAGIHSEEDIKKIDISVLSERTSIPESVLIHAFKSVIVKKELPLKKESIAKKLPSEIHILEAKLADIEKKLNNL